MAKKNRVLLNLSLKKINDKKILSQKNFKKFKYIEKLRKMKI